MHLPTLYDQLGGEAGIRALTARFYELMDSDPSAQTIRDLHPKDLSSSEQKLFEFMSGWSGGPQLFVEKYGHPRLRGRHMPFPIGVEERDQWLACMKQAITDTISDTTVQNKLYFQLAQLADFMRNAD
jgi:hemoglobin